MENNHSTPPSLWEQSTCELDIDYKIFQTYKCQFHNLSSDQFGDFVIIKSNDWVQVVAETIDHNIVLVRQFRFGSQEISLELPGGIMDTDESVISAARRELVEETGYTGDEATVIATLLPNPAIQTNRVHVVHIKNCKRTNPTNFDEFEDLQTLLYSRENLIKAVQTGTISHCITIAAITRFLSIV